MNNCDHVVATWPEDMDAPEINVYLSRVIDPRDWNDVITFNALHKRIEGEDQQILIENDVCPLCNETIDWATIDAILKEDK